MKLQAEIGGEPRNIEIRRDGENVSARIDDREYELTVSEPEPGIFLMKYDGRVYEAYSSPIKEKGHTKITLRGVEFDTVVVDPKRLRNTTVDHLQDGHIEIKTAMPGKVVRVLVEPGSKVAKGDGIVVVEAMKMQNEMRSPKDGMVKEVRVSDGHTVTAGQVLAVIE